MKPLSLFLTLSLLLGGNDSSSGFETPEGPITPDGYRPPAPTQENIESMIRDAIKNMVFIDGGSYMMGNFVCYSGDLDKMVERYQIPLIFCRTNEGLLHKVTLDSFHLNKYEISYYEYDLFTQAVKRHWIKYKFLNPEWWRQSRSYESAKRRFSNKCTGVMPAAIDWFQASDYCRWLGAVTGLPVELPTEAEWEYASRNRGQDFPYATDNGKIEQGRNYPSKEENKRRQPVKSFMPNPLGLHHMGFNVQEWVSDWYDENYYTQSPEKNPQGPEHGTKKILRGGVADNNPEFNHNFVRAYKDIDYTHDKEILEMFNFNEGDALFKHGARCAIHISQPIDIDSSWQSISQNPPRTAEQNGWQPRMAAPLNQPLSRNKARRSAKYRTRGARELAKEEQHWTTLMRQLQQAVDDGDTRRVEQAKEEIAKELTDTVKVGERVLPRVRKAVTGDEPEQTLSGIIRSPRVGEGRRPLYH